MEKILVMTDSCSDLEINESVLFAYPRMYIESAELRVYDLRNNLVFEKGLGPITGNTDATVRAWGGTDKHGKNLPPGLYIYIISTERRIICQVLSAS